MSNYSAREDKMTKSNCNIVAHVNDARNESRRRIV